MTEPLSLAHWDLIPDPSSPLVLAIGAFDGLHRGHRAVLGSAAHIAQQENAQLGVLRFAPHPLAVLQPDAAPPLLCTEAQTQSLLGELGVHLHLRVPFTPQTAETEPEHFLDSLFGGVPGLRTMVVGPNWRFGRQGRGDIALLRAHAAAQGIDTCVAQGLAWHHELISSTRIRQRISEGDLEATRAMLGRPYAVTGTVVSGKKLGRRLGFPTVNLRPDHTLLPPPGVYAMRVHLPQGDQLGAGYVVPGDSPLVEVHLLDFSGDLYDQHLEVAFLHFIRPPRPLPDLTDLRTQIGADIELIRALASADGSGARQP